MEVGLVSICNVESRCANICTKLCTCNLSVQTFFYFFLEENRCAERPFPEAEQVLTSCLLCFFSPLLFIGIDYEAAMLTQDFYIAGHCAVFLKQCTWTGPGMPPSAQGPVQVQKPLAVPDGVNSQKGGFQKANRRQVGGRRIFVQTDSGGFPTASDKPRSDI